MSKTILITGASTGFGRSTAQTLARAGHRVFASMRDIAGSNRSNAESLHAEGIPVVELDVTDEGSMPVWPAMVRVVEPCDVLTLSTLPLCVLPPASR